jgi:hypothetical protein
MSANAGSVGLVPDEIAGTLRTLPSVTELLIGADSALLRGTRHHDRNAGSAFAPPVTQRGQGSPRVRSRAERRFSRPEPPGVRGQAESDALTLCAGVLTGVYFLPLLDLPMTFGAVGSTHRLRPGSVSLNSRDAGMTT